MKVHDRIYMSSSTHGRSYIVETDDGLVMIDTYIADATQWALDEFKADGLDLSRLKALLLTHMHYDHTGGAAFVRATYGIPVVCHALDAQAIVEGDQITTASDIRWTGTSQPVPRCTIDHTPDDGDTVQVAGIEFEVIHLSGHTRGGVAYLWDGHMFIGDTILPGGRIGWSDAHWGSNIPDHAESVNIVTSLANRAERPPKRLYGGHGDPEDLTEALLNEARNNVQKLDHVGLPSRVSERVPRRVSTEAPTTIVVDGIPEESAMVPENFPTDLRRATLHQVTAGDLHGYIRPIGHMHGLNLVAGNRHEPITRSYQATMNLEHYCERARGSRFIPRTEVAQAYEVDRDSVTVHFAPHPDWAVTSRVRYTRCEDSAFDILFTFDFGANYTRFEAFIASYFAGQQIPYVAAGGNVFRPEIAPPSQLFFPRDPDTREQVSDGRWQFLDDFKLNADTYRDGMLYDAPITIHSPKDADWSFIQMVDQRECSAVSVNTFAYAQDFSLIGRDVSAGERVNVPARVILRQISTPDEATALWRVWQDELEADA
jgi:glyoxylase-like metal-dependent hydrolase (beta-lactamase superfamily II)